MLNKWAIYYKMQSPKSLENLIVSGEYIKNVQVIFRKEEHWTNCSPGFWEREVTGLSGCNWAEVGIGEKPIEQTAHAHELAHIHLNKIRGTQVSEESAHEEFRKANID